MLKITVFVKANSRFNKVQQLAPNEYLVHTTTPPLKGKANQTVIKLLSRHLHLSKNKIVLYSGETSPIKTFLILP